MKNSLNIFSNSVHIALMIALLVTFTNDSEACTDTGTDNNNNNNNNNNNDAQGIQRLLGDGVELETFDDRSTGEAIEDPSDLNCDDPSDCRWHNVATDEDELDYFQLVDSGNRGDDNLYRDRLDEYTGSSDTPDLPAYIAFPDEAYSDSDKAFLVSDPVFCAKRQRLRFKHWFTDNVDLQVCTRFVGDVEPDECVRVDSADNSGPTTVDLPDYEEPFELLFKSDGFTDDEQFVIIDDIEYDAELCDGNNIDDRDACPLLDCNFEPNTACANNVPGGSRGWRNVNGKFGNNKNTGIRTDANLDQRGYYAGLEGPTDSDSINMGNFALAEEKILDFSYYKASYATIFEVLLDGVSQYRVDETTRASRQWVPAQVRIPPGEHNLEFVGSNLGPNEYIGLDELRLLDANGNPYC